MTRHFHLGVTAVLLLTTGTTCSHVQPFVWADDLPMTASAPELYRVRAGDLVFVSVWNQPQLSGEHLVRADGRLTLALVGDIAVAGLTTSAVAEKITTKLEGMVVDPKVTVALRTARMPIVSVLGEVATPGQFELRDNEGILEVLARAGGLSQFADRDRIFLLRRDAEHPRIRFSYEQMTTRRDNGLSFALRDGDVIVVE